MNSLVDKYLADTSTPSIEAPMQAAPTNSIVDKYLDKQALLPPIPEMEGRSIPPSEITQTFGQASDYDVFSGNVNTGVDFALPKGTPVSVPQGNWQVLEATGGAGDGFIGDSTNQGYGNSVVVQNMDTGEKMRFSHLSDIGVTPGSSIQGGQIGLSGGSGNVTGPHLDLEYYDENGNIKDILSSPYAKYFQ